MSDQPATAAGGFHFGRNIPGGDRCCQKPVGCTNTGSGCLFLNHRWKRENVTAAPLPPNWPCRHPDHVGMESCLHRHPHG